jgi:hypothetical protein
LGIIELTERIKMMGIKKEFYLDLTNSDNNILDLSEYKGQKVKVFIQPEEIPTILPSGFLKPILIESYKDIETRENIYEK